MAIKSRLLQQRYSTTPAPMRELNITPLIDVLLVLLVMLILAIPIATHQVTVDLPRGGDGLAPEQEVFLTITQDGIVLWNGSAVDRPELEARLAYAAVDPAEPVIRFEPDANTSYDDAVQVIHLAGDAGVKGFAFNGNEQYRQFEAE